MSNDLKKQSTVLKMPQYEVHEFPWGTAVKNRIGKWCSLFISPKGQEIDVEGLDVELHENGIEFL